MIFRVASQISRKCFSTYPKRMYDVWKQDPSQVHSTWDEYFKNNDVNVSVPTNSPNVEREKDLALSAYLLIRYYKVNGHEIA